MEENPFKISDVRKRREQAKKEGIRNEEACLVREEDGL